MPALHTRSTTFHLCKSCRTAVAPGFRDENIRLQLRFLLPLVIILAGAAYLALAPDGSPHAAWFARDLNTRGALVANTLSESVADALHDAGRKLQALFERAFQDQRLGMAWCSPSGQLMRKTQRFPQDLDCEKAAGLAAAKDPELRIEGGRSTSASIP